MLFWVFPFLSRHETRRGKEEEEEKKSAQKPQAKK
jgi:hypothetical protein